MLLYESLRTTLLKSMNAGIKWVTFGVVFVFCACSEGVASTPPAPLLFFSVFILRVPSCVICATWTHNEMVDSGKVSCRVAWKLPLIFAAPRAWRTVTYASFSNPRFVEKVGTPRAAVALVFTLNPHWKCCPPWNALTNVSRSISRQTALCTGTLENKNSPQLGTIDTIYRYNTS